ncbi:hypothetical protein LTR08_003633 [Meristemomyces frigidus]|nr:hypothetical protein LTR08_003633 [Meristemomyces frigidus]
MHPAFADILEKRYFQFFRLQTVRATNSLVDSRFWDKVVLQMSHVEPAVKHAVLALSSMHQLSALPEGSEMKQGHRAFADKEHQKAIRAARVLIGSARPQDVERVLIACIIFICYDSVRGDFASSAIHMHSGRQIIVDNRQRLQQTSRRHDLREIEHTLFRLDIPTITFQDPSSPLSLTLDDYLRTQPMLVVPEFQTVIEARASLTDLVRWILVVGGLAADPTMPGRVAWHEDYENEVSKCAAQLHIWRECFENLLLDKPSSSTLSTAMLRLWHTGALIVVAAAGCGPQTRWDDLKHHFASIVSLAEVIVKEIPKSDGVSFSLEMGYLDPLWLVVSRCRDPTIRRRAIGLLRSFRRLEGVWDSAAVAAVGQRWMELEEEGLPRAMQASDIPESRRLSRVVTRTDAATSSARLQFEYRGVDGELCLRKEEEVQWGSPCKD